MKIRLLLLSTLALCAVAVSRGHQGGAAGQNANRFANVTHQFSLSFTKFLCREETNEVGSDEIWVFIFGLNSKKRGAPIAYHWCGPMNDVDKGEYHNAKGGPMTYFGGPVDLPNPNDMIFLAMVVEEDDSVSGGILNLGDMIRTNGAQYVDQGLDRPTIVSKLTADLRSAFRAGVRTILNDSDLVGIGEVPVTFGDLRMAAAAPLTKAIDIHGDGGKYRLFFELRGVKKP